MKRSYSVDDLDKSSDKKNINPSDLVISIPLDKLPSNIYEKFAISNQIKLFIYSDVPLVPGKTYINNDLIKNTINSKAYNFCIYSFYKKIPYTLWTNYIVEVTIPISDPNIIYIQNNNKDLANYEYLSNMFCVKSCYSLHEYDTYKKLDLEIPNISIMISFSYFNLLSHLLDKCNDANKNNLLDIIYWLSKKSNKIDVAKFIFKNILTLILKKQYGMTQFIVNQLIGLNYCYCIILKLI